MAPKIPVATNRMIPTIASQNSDFTTNPMTASTTYSTSRPMIKPM